MANEDSLQCYNRGCGKKYHAKDNIEGEYILGVVFLNFSILCYLNVASILTTYNAS